MSNQSIKPENVCKTRYAVFGLLQGLSQCEPDPITLLEQATALEQLACDLRVTAARVRDPGVNYWAKNAIL